MTNTTLTVSDIREMIKTAYVHGDFTVDKTGALTVEIIGCTFVADEDWIIRKPALEYVDRELEWYLSQSLYVEDIPGKTPAIWEQVASKEGMINSNYGWCIFSNENGNQYKNVYRELTKNRDSRRGTMIYNRPSMHYEFNKDGMSDFICTYANTFYIRDNKLISHYLMRSNDLVFGYCNDYAWAKYVQERLCKDLQKTYPDLECGDIIWTASNFHVYERHFKFIEELL